MTMTRTQTMVQLTADLVERLDAEAARRRVSRSALIREAVGEFLDNRSRAVAVEAYVAGYRRQPPGIPDEWGDLEAANDRAGRESGQRLDAEAEAAGIEW